MRTFDNTKKIVACVDGSLISEAVCDFGAFFSQTLGLPLELLNAIAHSHLSTSLNLSGNIGLGSREDLLEILVNEEESDSKCLIAEGKMMLTQLKARALQHNAQEVSASQKHGELYERVAELEAMIRLLILGLRGKDHEHDTLRVGAQVEEIIRTLHVPILLVNHAFEIPRKILIAYDGSASSKKALKIVSNTPFFAEVERHIVNVNKDKEHSERLLKEACEMLGEGLTTHVKYISLRGDSVQALLTYQKENAIDLIAMGAFSHSRIRDVLLGSFTSKMIFSTPKPLLLLR